MTYELLLFIPSVAAELFELLWQKSSTLYLMHPSYIFAIYLVYLSQYNLWILAILVIKSIDIIFKVLLIHKHYVLDELTPEMKLMLLQPLHPIMLTMGLMLYPCLLYMAIF